MKPEEIKRLLEKYYEGATTSEEERLLKTFFSGEDIPEDLRDEKEIFRYFMLSAAVPEPSPGFEEKIIYAIGREDRNIAGSGIRRLYVTLTGIAAVLLILTGSYFFFKGKSEPRDTYSDPELAYTETMKILYEVSARLNQGTKALGHLSAMQEETQKTMATVSRSTAIIEEKIKPLDSIFEAIGKADRNYEKNIN